MAQDSKATVFVGITANVVVAAAKLVVGDLHRCR